MIKNFVNINWFEGTALDAKLLGNSYGDYLIFIGVFLVLTLAVKLTRKALLALSLKIAKHSESKLPDFIIAKLKKLLVPLEYFGVFYFAVNMLELNKYVVKTLDVVGLLVVVFYAVRFLIAIVDFAIEMKLAKNESSSRATVIRSIIPAVNISIWGIGIVFVLSNLGFNISALVTGLGIGGIAVALAAQSLLGDLFSYVSILADKPFEINDLLIIDGFAGRVSHIGIKTTRLTSVTGEELIFSNSDLTKSRIKNYQKTLTRRGEINIGVTYETSREKLEIIPKIIKDIVESKENTRLDRSHFVSYGDFSLNFQTVFWVDNDDYITFMNTQQEILLDIFKAFDEQGIEFAYPTQKFLLGKTQA